MPYLYETHIYTFFIGEQNLNLKQTYQNYKYTIICQDRYIQGPYQFDVPNKLSEQPTKFLIFGDMDSNWNKNISKPTFDWIQNQINNNIKYDALLYLGDMAYDLQTNNYTMSEYWLKNISHFTRRYPFMTTPGNHDNGDNNQFQYIRANFKTLRFSEFDTNNFYNDLYSFEIGHVHFIEYNPYWTIYDNDTTHFTQKLLVLMQHELELANLNREQIPWLIIFNHYPLYCSDPRDEKCSLAHERMKDFEKLFKQYKVDLLLAGHQHNYERNKPFYQNKLASFNWDGQLLTNYDMPIEIIEGSAGNEYFMPEKTYNEQPFTWIQHTGTGVGILNVVNKTHLYFEHILTENDTVADSIWIVKSINQSDTIFSYSYFKLSCVVILLLILILPIILYYKSQKNKQRSEIQMAKVVNC